MKNHPGHFWICFWLVMIGLTLSDGLVGIKAAIEANTVASSERKNESESAMRKLQRLLPSRRS
jgi:hypothetical protein